MQMSYRWGKVATLMETQNEMTTNDDSANTGTATGRYAELQQLVAGMASDFEKFYKDGNKAAGTRVRNAMQELKAFAQTVRNEVTELKNSATKETA
ncbi:MAG: histone [Myxococcales bacterium]|nr:histone [Myxococcales bacterium]